MNLEDRLRGALAPLPRSPDVADAVLGRLARAARPPMRAVPRWALAASIVLAFVGGAVALRGHQELRDRQAAANQLAHALEITSRELGVVQERVNRHLQEKGT